MANVFSFHHRLLNWNKKNTPETVDAEQYAKAFGQFKKLLLEQYQIRIQAKTAKRLPINLSAKPTHFGTSPARAALYFDDLTIESEDIATEIDKILNNHQRLLLIGDPGAGKTTILLFAAINILQGGNLGGNPNLGGNFKLPPKLDSLPLILNLATWQKDRGFKEWYAQSIAHTYSLSPVFVAELLRRNAVVPFFDGFDEVAEAAREDCFQKMGAYFGDQRSRQLIVSSRKKEYSAAAADAPVYAEIEVQPLSLEQIRKGLSENALTQAADRALLDAINRDEWLAKAVETPFYLNTASFLFGKGQRTLRDFPFKTDSLEGRQEELVETFVEEQVPEEKDRRRLQFLATKMKEENFLVFELVKMQPRWCAKLKRYRLASGLTFGGALGLASIFTFELFSVLKNGLLIGSVVGGLLYILLVSVFTSLASGPSFDESKVKFTERLYSFLEKLIISIAVIAISALIGALVVALIIGWIGVMTISWSKPEIKTEDIQDWRINTFIMNWKQGLIGSFLFILAFSLIGSALIILLGGVKFGMIGALSFTLTFAIILGVKIVGTNTFLILSIINPYQRFWAALRSSLWKIPVILFSLFVGIWTEFRWGKVSYQHELLTFFQETTLWTRYLPMVLVLFLFPLFSSQVLNHFSLRLILWLENKLPLRLVTFLDCQTDQHIFEDNRRTINGKKQRGAIWRFRHKILQDYFAKMEA